MNDVLCVAVTLTVVDLDEREVADTLGVFDRDRVTETETDEQPVEDGLGDGALVGDFVVVIVLLRVDDKLPLAVGDTETDLDSDTLVV